MAESFWQLQKNNTEHPSSPANHILAARGLGLGGSALGALLALDALGLATGTGGGGLGLLSLLLAVAGGLLVLGVLDGLLAGGGAGLGALVAALLDHIERGTDDGALVLDGTAGTLLGNLLYVARRISPVHLLLRSAAQDPSCLFRIRIPIVVASIQLILIHLACRSRLTSEIPFLCCLL